MSESPEVEKSMQNPKGRTNLQKEQEAQPDTTDPAEPTKVASVEISPRGNQMRNIGRTDTIGTA